MEPKDLGELQGSLNEAAGKASALLTTFLTFLVYLTITLGSVKHRDLFLETPIQLPLLNVQLPLPGFFVVAPTVVLLFHVYVLLQLLALTKKAKYYEAALREAVPLAADRQAMRQRLDSFLVLQFLAGPKDQREGLTGLFLRLISWLSLVGAPLLVLLLAQVTFLPYHKEWVLWWLRFLVLLDVLLIWVVWNQIRIDGDESAPAGRRTLWLWLGLLLTLGVDVFSVLVAIYPGEFAYDVQPTLRFIPKSFPPEWRVDDAWQTVHEFLFAGQPDSVSGEPRSLLSDRLVLMDQSFVDDPDKLDKLEVGRSFRGRDLKYAALNRADLRKADFVGARLDPAYLVGAKLKGAKLGCAATSDVIDSCTSLQGAVLSKAQLQGADLSGALLQGADLSGALLHGANLSQARLEGAHLLDAQLQGADLSAAHLEGADLSKARLQGADLSAAHLEGANLSQAQLQGAVLGAAHMQGADLSGAQLQGADLSGAGLQGANLLAAGLQDASLEGAFLWRARGRPDRAVVARYDGDTRPWDEMLEISSLATWRDSILERIDEGGLRDAAMTRLSSLDAPQDAPADLTPVELWTKPSPGPAAQDERERHFSASLADLACSSDAAPYVARALIGSGRIASAGAHIAIIADRLWTGKSDPSACPGVAGFTDEDWINVAELCSNSDTAAADALAAHNGTPGAIESACGRSETAKAREP